MLRSSTFLIWLLTLSLAACAPYTPRPSLPELLGIASAEHDRKACPAVSFPSGNKLRHVKASQCAARVLVSIHDANCLLKGLVAEQPALASGVRLDLCRLPPALTSLKEADTRQPTALVLLFHKEMEPFSAALLKVVACAADFFASDIQFAAIGDVRTISHGVVAALVLVTKAISPLRHPGAFRLLAVVCTWNLTGAAWSQLSLTRCRILCSVLAAPG